MRNASRDYYHITARHRFFYTVWIVFVPKAETSLAICNTEDFV
jgi:hypothetical protein